MRINTLRKLSCVSLAATAFLVAPTVSNADQVILDDLIVDGSICAGMDCVNGESFGFDTLRLKENNLRIRAVDTSSTSSFPSSDWQITFNDSGNGGLNKFSIDDIDGGRTPFTLEANAPSHSLYVDDGGRLGLGTSTPVVQLHVKDGNTPTLRLEQDGSAGFTPQTWDVAGNEANFFVRDATNGSTLPFKIFPGAPNNALTIEASTGDIGLGTTSPEAPLHVQRSNATAGIIVRETNGTDASRDMLRLTNNGNARIMFEDTGSGGGEVWRIDAGTSFAINGAAVGGNEFVLTSAGNLTITGSLTTAMNTLPDYVFSPDYPLMPLDKLAVFIKENKHLPNVPSQADVDKAGKLNMTQMQIKILEKVEELTLYTLEQEKRLKELKARLAALEPTKVAN